MVDIFEVVECVGTMPANCRQVLVALVPKKGVGAFRPIGIYTSFNRVWTKCRLLEVREWEAANRRDYITAAKGSGALDVVWAQAVRAEGNVHSKVKTAVLLWELKSFFDNIDHGLLTARGYSN